MRKLSRLVAALALVLAWTGATMIQPSWACGCGALITNGPAIGVDQETSIVRYDQGTEQIVMRLTVRSDAKDAAWLLPTPSAARVELGDRAWFDELDRLTEPKIVVRHTWWGPLFPAERRYSAAAPQKATGPGQVTVLGEQRLGPFLVATLAAADSGALASWLAAHGYALSPRLAQGLRPYVAQGWTYVAIKLAPAAGSTLTGRLDPLHITFRSARPVYPLDEGVAFNPKAAIYRR